jgi:hypothetical protein
MVPKRRQRLRILRRRLCAQRHLRPIGRKRSVGRRANAPAESARCASHRSATAPICHSILWPLSPTSFDRKWLQTPSEPSAVAHQSSANGAKERARGGASSGQSGSSVDRWLAVHGDWQQKSSGQMQLRCCDCLCESLPRYLICLHACFCKTVFPLPPPFLFRPSPFANDVRPRRISPVARCSHGEIDRLVYRPWATHS